MISDYWASFKEDVQSVSLFISHLWSHLQTGWDSTKGQSVHEAAADGMPQDQRWSICVQYEKRRLHALTAQFWPACIRPGSVQTDVMVQCMLSHQSGHDVASGNSHDGCRLPGLDIRI